MKVGVHYKLEWLLHLDDDELVYLHNGLTMPGLMERGTRIRSCTIYLIRHCEIPCALQATFVDKLMKADIQHKLKWLLHLDDDELVYLHSGFTMTELMERGMLTRTHRV